MDNKQTVFVAGYPKSGTTWLTRLLGDVLNSPTGGCTPSEDHKEVATEGQDRPGDYIVRKGHFVLIDDGTGPVVPRPHRLAWKQLTDEKIVFIVRDPRDICISGAYHWRVSPEQFLLRMIKGDVARCGQWDQYVNNWLSLHSSFGSKHKKVTCLLTYESLVNNSYANVKFVLDKFSIKFDSGKMGKAAKRQSFEQRKAQIKHRSWHPTEPGNVKEELGRNNMRKGVAGDWKNHFTKEMNDRIWLEFGWMMERFGYSK